MPNDWENLIDSAVALRRQLHQRPELTWQETETAATIRKVLDEAGIPWRACAETGTVASLAAGATGRHIALRGDIDAIPVTEATQSAWASQHAGRMHACGHDGHTATLIAAALWLKRHEAALPGPVTLLFQPAEEGGHGARQMIVDGALDGVDAIFGWHNWPAIAFGQAICPDGVVMCANGTFEIAVQGKGGHASQPELCRDPVLAASAIVLALQQIVSRRLQPQQPTVVSVTSIEAPSMATVIPSEARIGGSIRFGNPTDSHQIFELIASIARSTAESYGVSADVNVQSRYGPTVNHAVEAGQVRQHLAAELGSKWLARSLPVPVMASEDFSYYLQKIPGAFFLLGGDDGLNHDAPCHSPLYDFNDRLIPVVVRLFARLAGAPLPDPMLRHAGISGQG
jgi:amidohydrolase